jgi:hypothetical protein
MSSVRSNELLILNISGHQSNANAVKTGLRAHLNF